MYSSPEHNRDAATGALEEIVAGRSWAIYIGCPMDDGRIQLEGYFSAEELERIAAILRDMQ